jgi:AcrR family transcriptional regulator
MPRPKDPAARLALTEKLVAAAEKLVTAKGADALNARTLAKNIGYSLGHLYNLFPDLNALVLAVNGRTLDRLAEALVEVKGKNRLSRLAETYLEFTSENKNLWEMVLTHRLKPNEKLPKDYADKVAMLPKIVEAALLELHPKAKPADLRRDVALLWAALHGLGTLGTSGRLALIDAPAPEKLAKQLIELYEKE